MNFKNLVCLFIIGCLGCSPQKSLKKGNFDRSFETSLKAVKKLKKISKNTAVLKASLDEILNRERSKIEAFKSSTILREQETAFFLNLELQDKITAANPFLFDQYTPELKALRQEATEMKSDLAFQFFQSGKANLSISEQQSSKIKAQKAYLDFEKAKRYGTLEHEIDFLMDKSMELALVVYHFEIEVYNHSHEIIEQFKRLERLSNKFRKVHVNSGYSALDANCNFRLKFLPLDIDQNTTTDSKTFLKEVKTGSERISDSTGTTTIDIYEEVCGTVYIQEKSKVASLQVIVESPENDSDCITSRRFFCEEYESSAQEISTSGDMRAIPCDYKRSTAQCLSSNSYMASRLIDDLYDEIYSSLYNSLNRQND